MDRKPSGPRFEEVGDANIPTALLALCQPLPETLYCPYNPVTDRFLFRKLETTEDCGLVVFVNPQEARHYIRTVLPWGSYNKVRQLALDEAHDLALARHAVVNCLLVVQGCPWQPAVYYVR